MYVVSQHHEQVDFLILADSFMDAWSAKGIQPFAAEVVSFLQTLGLAVAVVYQPGACWQSGDYLRMLEYYDSRYPRVQAVMTISMGNDLYRYDVDSSTSGCIFAAMEAFRRSPASCNPFHVYGGSSSVWNHPQHWQFDRYDDVVRQVNDDINASLYAKSVDGAKELQGISTADRLGHLSPESIPIALSAVQRWLEYATQKHGLKSRL
jgi:hypothetical protein